MGVWLVAPWDHVPVVDWSPHPTGGVTVQCRSSSLIVFSRKSRVVNLFDWWTDTYFVHMIKNEVAANF
jgi:hypothetical protein